MILQMLIFPFLRVILYVLEGENKIMGIAELASGEITDESMQFAKTLIAG